MVEGKSSIRGICILGGCPFMYTGMMQSVCCLSCKDKNKDAQYLCDGAYNYVY